MTPLDSASQKAYWRLLPLCFICYVIAYVDRANVANAPSSFDAHVRSPDVFGHLAEEMDAERLLIVRDVEEVDPVPIAVPEQLLAPLGYDGGDCPLG